MEELEKEARKKKIEEEKKEKDKLEQLDGVLIKEDKFGFKCPVCPKKYQLTLNSAMTVEKMECHNKACKVEICMKCKQLYD